TPRRCAERGASLRSSASRRPSLTVEIDGGGLDRCVVRKPSDASTSLGRTRMLMFRTLWNVHPSNNGDDFHCTTKKGDIAFDNQCAIRMGVALAEAGMNTSSFRGARCWHGHKHILRVEELIKWLKTKKEDVGKARSFKPGSDALDA